MSVMNGQVKVTLEMTGKGDAPAKAKETTGALEKMKGAADGAGDSATSLKDRMGAIKSSVGPVNLVRETFENLRGNLGLVGSAVGGVITVVGLLVSTLHTSSVAAERWETAQAGMEESAKKSATMIAGLREELDKLNGIEPKSRLDILSDEAHARLVELNSQITAGGAATKELKDDLSLLSINPLAAFTAKSLTSELRKGQEDLNKLKREQMEIEPLLTEEGRQQEISALRRVQALRDYLSEAPKAAPANDNLNMPNIFGEVETDAQRAAREKRLAEAVRKNPPRRGGGGGKRKLSPSEVEALLGGPTNSDGLDEFWSRFENTASAGSPNANTAGLSDGAGTGERGKSRMQMLAGDVRDFTASLSESIPEMDAFSSALGAISQMWGEYAETGKGAARATIMSVGAIAMAGAEQIKNERLRAGVLSIIHLGLGTALMFVPGQQQEALGHLAGAAILGSVAIFGGSSSGGGKSSPGSSRSVVRPLSDARQGSGGINITINGDWHGQSSPQETAAALHARINAGRSSGYVPPMGRAAGWS